MGRRQRRRRLQQRTDIGDKPLPLLSLDRRQFDIPGASSVCLRHGDLPDPARRRPTVARQQSSGGLLGPQQWEQELETADPFVWNRTSPAQTHAGGAYRKVIRWAFEKQGLFRAAGQPATQEGKPPAVDVYIDDGRHGEYPFQPNHWSCTDIWNRLTVGDGGGVHQEPEVGTDQLRLCAHQEPRHAGGDERRRQGLPRPAWCRTCIPDRLGGDGDAVAERPEYRSQQQCRRHRRTVQMDAVAGRARMHVLQRVRQGRRRQYRRPGRRADPGMAARAARQQYRPAQRSSCQQQARPGALGEAAVLDPQPRQGPGAARRRDQAAEMARAAWLEIRRSADHPGAGHAQAGQPTAQGRYRDNQGQAVRRGRAQAGTRSRHCPDRAVRQRAGGRHDLPHHGGCRTNGPGGFTPVGRLVAVGKLCQAGAVGTLCQAGAVVPSRRSRQSRRSPGGANACTRGSVAERRLPARAMARAVP